jgi:antitoxin YefM
MSENVSLAEIKNRLSEYVDRVEREHERVVITKHGRPAAVVISVDDLESLEETLAIMSNPELMAQIREADADVKAGRVSGVSKIDLLASLAR